jgi:hypothetical protein
VKPATYQHSKLLKTDSQSVLSGIDSKRFFFSLSQVLNNKSLDFTEMCVSLEKLKSLNENSS